MKVCCVAALLMCAMVGPAGAGEMHPFAAPIAYYPLVSDSLDALGLNDPMIIVNAPFQDGGLYCSGIYLINPGGMDVRTSQIAALDYGSLAASIEFKIDQYPSGTIRPILVAGMGWRWMGADLYADGRIALRYNNSGLQAATQVVSLDVWHQVLLSYDGTSHLGTLYLDGESVCSVEYVLESDENDRNFSAYNPSTGVAFMGLIRHLVVYDHSFDPTPAKPASWGLIKLLSR